MAEGKYEEDYSNIGARVHVPPCDNRECRQYLQKLVETLVESKIACEHKYPPNGLFRNPFDNSIRTTPFTILHMCPQFFAKISNFPIICELQESAFAKKIICVVFHKGDEDYPPSKEDNNKDHAVCLEYFKEFNKRYISSDDSYTELVQEVKTLLNENHFESLKKVGETFTKKDLKGVRPHSTPLEYYMFEQKNEDPENSTYMNEQSFDDEVFDMIYQRVYEATEPHENQPTMTVFPDMFGNTRGQQVNVRSDYLQPKPVPVFKTISELKKCLDSFKDLQKETITENLIFFLKKVIPGFYSCKNMFPLAHIAMCSQTVLRDESFVMMELLLLEGRIDCASLRKTELLLYVFQERIRKSTEKIENRELQIQRLGNLLTMICYELAIQDPSNTEDQFKPTKSKKFNPIPKEKPSEYMTMKEDLYKCPPKELMKTVDEFNKISETTSDDKVYAFVKKLANKIKTKQLIVIYTFLKKMFSMTNTLPVLGFLKRYVSKNLPYECLTMIVHALSLFLCHGLTRDKDIQEVCDLVTDVLKNIIIKKLPSQERLLAQHLLCMLIFDKTPAIRKGMIEHFKIRNKYYSEFHQLLLSEITRLLCPLFVLDDTKNRDDIKSTWPTAFGKFCEKPVVALFHKPKEKDHCERSEAVFVNFVDTMHTNQINTLLKLHHKNIIIMYAYQIARIPQFYVVEDYVTKNLQVDLKNKNKNRSYFDQPTLMRAILCALDALDYCHSKDIVHRNLTAESLFLVGNDNVKLCGFTLAIDLKGQKEVIAIDGSPQIPTRWSAPESLSKLKFSKTSDICMFGKLIYEILTHGALPYSHRELTQKEFISRVTTNQIQLCRESCIKKEVFDIISSCVSFDADHRPNTQILKEILHEAMTGISAQDTPKYPSFTEPFSDYMRKSSSGFDKGTPENECLPGDYINLMCVPCVPYTSNEQIRQYEKGDGFLFRQFVNRKLSQEILNYILSETPQCMTIHEVHEDKYILEYFIATHNVTNLYDFIKKTYTDENDLSSFLILFVKIAEILNRLHKASFVLGDLSGNTVFIAMDENTVPQPHVVCWSSINSAHSTSTETQLNQYETNEQYSVLERPAPEIQQNGTLLPASDVFYFGQLLKECTNMLKNQLDVDFIYTRIPSAEDQQHSYLLKNIMAIAMKCIEYDSRDRLTMSTVVGRLIGVHESAGMKTDCSRYEEVSIRRRSAGDNQSETTPKAAFNKRNSIDSAFASGQQFTFNKSTTLPKTLIGQDDDNSSDTKLMTVAGGTQTEVEIDGYVSPLEDLYNDGTSYPSIANIVSVEVNESADLYIYEDESQIQPIIEHRNDATQQQNVVKRRNYSNTQSECRYRNCEQMFKLTL